jgi:uncharacterized radical SAM superfamily Fe-S cluster-containing enzyme
MAFQLSPLANVAWNIVQKINKRLPDRSLPTPSWSGRPLMKKTERSMPPLGPRLTQSVCPSCLLETRNGILRGKQQPHELTLSSGLITAEILEEAGTVIMRKSCDRHGPFEDLLASNAKFFWRMEGLFPGCDFERLEKSNYGDQGARYGRGSFLIVDLTTRCNMKCDTCFMNANEIGHVDEISIAEIRALLDHSAEVMPRREFNILFSGGEPTLSPHFLEAVRYAKSLGYTRLHVATNGIRFAEEPEFAKAARDAGLHAVYLQLDGTTNEKNAHRGIANLFGVKHQAIENIADAGMRVTLQVTVIRGVNNDNVGSIVEFAIKNNDKIFGVVFQPIMFTGRDEEVTDARRYEQRYTLSQLASDLQEQTIPGWEPLRDWFPMGSYGTFCTYIDMLYPDRKRGSTYVNSHPDSAVFSALVMNRETGDWKPVSAFFNVERFLSDIESIIDAAFSPTISQTQLVLSILRNFEQSKAPKGLTLRHLPALLKQCVTRMNGQVSDWSEKVYDKDEWSILVIGGMWFQDLFNYELANIQMSTALVADSGIRPSKNAGEEVPFSFKNAAGWRQVVERARSLPSLSTWHRKHGRHAIYTNGISVSVADLTSSLAKVSAEVVNEVETVH